MISLSTPNTISGRSAFIELLQSEGVTHLFGNPGTTELPIMHALADYPDMRYVLGLQEAIVVAMADGYARASGELVACNVHVAPGLGNAMGSLFTAFNSGTPLIITAGQQEQGHGLSRPERQFRHYAFYPDPGRRDRDQGRLSGSIAAKTQNTKTLVSNCVSIRY